MVGLLHGDCFDSKTAVMFIIILKLVVDLVPMSSRKIAYHSIILMSYFYTFQDIIAWRWFSGCWLPLSTEDGSDSVAPLLSWCWTWNNAPICAKQRLLEKNLNESEAVQHPRLPLPHALHRHRHYQLHITRRSLVSRGGISGPAGRRPESSRSFIGLQIGCVEGDLVELPGPDGGRWGGEE